MKKLYLLLLVAIAAPASAQNVVLMRAGSGSRVQVSPGVPLIVPITIDMASAGGGNIATLATNVAWLTTRLSFDSVRAATFGGTLTPNTTATGTGTLGLSASAGANTATTILANAYFTPRPVTGSTRISLAPSTATDGASANILSSLRVQELDVCVAPPGNWGDANNDLNVNIIDAQQVARFSVGLGVANAGIVQTQGDVNNDNTVNIIDAQQVARFSVGLSAAVRINTVVYTPPSASTLTVANVFDATAGGTNVGVPANIGALLAGAQAQIQPLARDAQSVDVTACAPISYLSSNVAAATVSSSGLVTAVAAGSTTITVSSGSTQAQLTVVVQPSSSGVIAWTNASGGLWSTASNWSLNRIPAAADSVVINAAGTYTVTMDVNFSGYFVDVGGATGTQSLLISGRTVALTSALLNRASGIVTVRSSTMNATLTNQGTTVVEGTSALNGAIATTASSVLRIFGNSAGGPGHAVVTIGNGFTNNGVLDITGQTSAFVVDASLTMTGGGIIVNAPGAFFTVNPGNSGGQRTYNGSLDNQGTFTINQVLGWSSPGGNSSSGAITVAGGNLNLAQSAGATFTNSGTISLTAGRTFGITGGSVANALAGTITGVGTFVVASGTTASLQGSITSNLSVTGTPVTMGAPQVASGVSWLLSSSTVNGTSLTVASGGTATLRNATVNVPVDNQGSLILEGTTAMNGALTTSAASLLRIFGNSTGVSGGHATVTIANGFTNLGTLDITSQTGAFVVNSALTVTNGTLTNAAGASITVNSGNSGGARGLTASVDNQGTIGVLQPLSWTATGNTQTSGTINAGADVTFVQPSNATFTNAGTIAIAAARTFFLGVGTVIQTAASLVNGAGTLVIANAASAIFQGNVASNVSLTNTPTSVGAPQVATGVSWLISGSTFNGTSLSVASGGTATVRNATINVPVDNQGALVAEGTSTFNGAVTTTATSVLRIFGNSTGAGGGHAAVTIANGFTNLGTLDITSQTGAFVANSSLAVSAGVLTNAPGASITVNPGNSGGARSLTAAVDNQGTLTVSQLLTWSAGGNTTNTGSIAVAAGDLSVSQSNLASFTNSASITIASGRTLTITSGNVINAASGTLSATGTLALVNGTGASLQGTVSTNVSISNTPTTVIAPQIASGASWLITGSTVSGTSLTIGSGGTATFRNSTMQAPLDNQGTLVAEGSSAFNAALTTSATSLFRVFGNSTGGGGGHATVTIANGFTNLGTLDITAQTGAFVVDATLTVASGTFTNAAGASITVNSGNSGGNRSLVANLDNQGVLTLNHPLAWASGATNITNGTINVSGGNLTLTQQSGAAVTIAGSVVLAAGRTFTVNGGTVTHSASGTMTGTGTFSVASAVSLSVVGPVASNLSIASTPTTIGTPQVAGGVSWLVSNSTVNGNSLSVANGGTATLRNAIVNTPLNNQGTVIAEGTSTLNGALTTSTGSLFRVFGNSSGGGGGHAVITIANGFVNQGTIDITSQTQAFLTNASLTITSGTLINASGASITANAGNSGGARTLAAALDNQGTITVNTPLSWASNGVSQSSGTATVNFDLSLTQQAGGSFTNSGPITIASGRTFLITGAAVAFGGTSPVSGSGTLAIASATSAALVGPISVAVTLNSTPTALSTQATSGTPWLIVNSTITGGGFVVGAGQTLTLRNATMNLPIDNSGTIVAEGTSALNDTFTTNPGSVLRIFGNSGGGAGHAAVTIANGFTNQGTIDLTSFTQAFLVNASLTITSGTLFNVSGGTITTNPGNAGGTRTIVGAFDNSGVMSIHPGTTGALTLTGTFANTGTLNVDISSSAVDLLNVSSTATLAGTLSVTLLGGFIPTSGQQFQLLTAGTVVGNFATTQPSGWSAVASSTTVKAQAP